MQKSKFQCFALLGTVLIAPFLSSTSLLAEPTPLPTVVSADVLPDMVERISGGVINISSVTIINYRVYGMDEFMQLWGIPQERKHTSLGSGFIIDKDGYAITNNHVVDKASEVLVTLADQRQFKARIVGKDQKMDLALIQIQDENKKVPKGLKPIPMGNSDRIRIGETVVAVGNPFGLQNTVTRGIISAKNRTIGLGPFDNFIQTDASINPGNSGGGLFNLAGQVIGINSAIRSHTGQSIGLGFAIPVNEAKALLPDLKRYGRVPRPWLGILSEKMSMQLSAYYEMPGIEGVLVYSLVRKAPAHRAGLSKGDVIVNVDGVDTTEPNQIERILAKHKPTDQITIKAYLGRDLMKGRKNPRTLNVRLTELPRLDDVPQGII